VKEFNGKLISVEFVAGLIPMAAKKSGPLLEGLLQTVDEVQVTARPTMAPCPGLYWIWTTHCAY